MKLRPVLVVLVGVGAILFVGERLVRSSSLPPRDFVEYWSAGAVAARGGNAYDPVPLLAAQQEIDPERTGAVMMWNPPWSLAVYVPLGFLPPGPATLLWLALQLLAVMVAADLLWRTYVGERMRWVGQLAALAFVGTWWMVLYCQNTGLLVLGLAGFAYFWKADRPAVAGAFAALTALKPHLLAPFGVLLVVGVMDRRGRVALAAGAGVLLAATAVAWVANPQVLNQYIDAAKNPPAGAVPLSEWTLPVASYWFRVGIDRSQFAWQFVPCAVACVLLVGYRVWRGAAWDWPRELPLVVWASVLTTPYGGWIFDLTVLLVPVVATVAGTLRVPLAVVPASVAGLCEAGATPPDQEPRPLPPADSHIDPRSKPPASQRPATERPRAARGACLLLCHAAIVAASLMFAGALHAYWWVAPAVLVIGLVSAARADGYTGGARPPG